MKNKKHRIKFFKSFEEQELYELEQVIQQEPIDRVRETVDLIIRIYGFTRETLMERVPVNKITIVK